MVFLKLTPLREQLQDFNRWYPGFNIHKSGKKEILKIDKAA